jgi:hypothetical protein
MPATSIVNNGGSIKLTIGAQIRNVTKSQIIEVSVIKTNIIKIDVGKGALHNIFIPYIDVTVPSTPNADALREAITALITPESSGGSAVGSATEAKQIEEIGLLTTINSSITAMTALVTTIDNKIFYEPMLVDDGGAGLIYKGFALNAGTNPESPLWAIQRIQKVGDVDVYTWANGTKTFINSWLDRETISYS